jgi:hypothetical protein
VLRAFHCDLPFLGSCFEHPFVDGLNLELWGVQPRHGITV